MTVHFQADCGFLHFDYKNYRGEINYRRAVVQKIEFTSTEYHTDPQWIMRAFDLDKGDFRDFAMRDMKNVLRFEGDGK